MAVNAVQVELLLAGVRNNSGQPVNGGKVYTYDAGTTSDRTTWTDSGRVTPAANPIILDSNGKAQIYADGAYKFRIDGADDVTLFTYDNLFYLTTTALSSGIISLFGGTSAPTGWLLCDGTAVSRSTYASLFAVIATAFGVGDGSTTFNLPDLRGRFPIGKATSGTGSTLGGTGGAIDHTHTGGAHTHDMASHTHTGPSHTHSAGGLRASLGINLGDSIWRAVLDGVNTFTSTHKVLATGQAVSADVNSSTSCTLFGDSAAAGTGATGAPSTNTSGSAGAVATTSGNPPFQAVNYIIKT